jgi:hypothetical protein
MVGPVRVNHWWDGVSVIAVVLIAVRKREGGDAVDSRRGFVGDGAAHGAVADEEVVVQHVEVVARSGDEWWWVGGCGGGLLVCPVSCRGLL